MADTKQRSFEFRAKLPGYVRVAAIAAIGITVLLVVVGFYRERNKAAFRLKPEHTQLSKDVTAEINGYERLETDGEVKKYYVKADHARTFSDNHQELDNVYIEVYGEGNAIDKLTAQSALYVPEEGRDFTAYLKGDVNIETRDALKVQTENIVYTKKDDSAVADELVKFERANVSGQAVGANVDVANKRLHLLRDVDVDVNSDETGSASSVKNAKFKGGSATYDQAANTLEVNGGMEAHMVSPDGFRNTDLRAQRTIASLTPSDNKTQPSLKTIELFDDVWVETKERGARQSTMETAYAFYDKAADRFVLKNGVHMITGADETTDLRSGDAIYEQTAGNLKLGNGAEITRGTGYVKGDTLYAVLSAAKKVTNSRAVGSAYLRNAAAERITEITADELTADFDDAQQPVNAKAIGNARAVVTPTEATDYTSVTINSKGSLTATFRAGGLPSVMKTDGRSTIQLNAPNGVTDAVNKRVTADTVNVTFNDNGKDIRRAEAAGNAELFIEPIRASAKNYKTTVYAPKFDCEFYATGNNAKQCVGATDTKTVREPTVPAEGRGNQVLAANRLTAIFNEGTKDVERLEAAGNSKFTELDRNAIADAMTFTQSDQVVRLRGGEPTFWDAASRAKAPEIDWDTTGQRSSLRGGVSTTYYSRKRGGDATPFGSSDKPVFATAQAMDVDYRSETAVYSGNARAWQESNYVRGDRLTIDQQKGTFFAEGTVQSLLYEAKQRRKTANGTVPVSASAASLAYSRDSRVLQYRNSVDIRQGTDRLLAQIADIYLDQNNEMVKTVVENNVVITQPGRKAVGDWAEYTAENEVAVIRGNPARVDDSENGTSQGGQITVYLRDNRVLSEGGTKQNTSARTRSVYKMKTVP